MVRSLSDTYYDSIDKLGLDRQLANFLADNLNAVARRHGWRIARCSDDFNLWFVNDPERGWLHGRFWKCGSKLCSFCLSSQSFVRRKRLRNALDLFSQFERDWYFVTFTIENPHASIPATRDIINAAWAKLRKRAVFGEVRAGCKSEEFTITKNGFHYHLHTLLNAPKLSRQMLKLNWTECVESSGGQSRNLFGYQTYDGFLIVDVKKITNPQHVVNEVAKYITKSTSFRALSRETLSELASIKRWHRMFELFGGLRETRVARDVQRTHASTVHTKSLSDGPDCDRWWFEKRRSNSRLYHEADISIKFSSEVYSLTQMRGFLKNVAT